MSTDTNHGDDVIGRDGKPTDAEQLEQRLKQMGLPTEDANLLDVLVFADCSRFERPGAGGLAVVDRVRGARRDLWFADNPGDEH